jgi:hypothetical protein
MKVLLTSRRTGSSAMTMKTIGEFADAALVNQTRSRLCVRMWCCRRDVEQWRTQFVLERYHREIQTWVTLRVVACVKDVEQNSEDNEYYVER